MNNLEFYQIIFEDSYNTYNKLIDIAIKHSDRFSLFRSCDSSEDGFYDNLKDVCIKRFYEIFKTIFKKDTTDKFHFAHYLQEVELWYEILNKPEKNELDAISELKLKSIDFDLKLLNELDDYLIEKQFTNYSETNMLIGLGEKCFFKSNKYTKRILLDNYKRVFDCTRGSFRDLAFYRNGNGFIKVNTGEDYIYYCYDESDENTYKQILEDLIKLKGMQIIDSFTRYY